MSGVRIGLIGGSGFEKLLRQGEIKRIGTPYGPSPDITVAQVDAIPVAFLPRHGTRHESPPHKVNFRANLWSLKQMGVERIIATNAVGAMRESYRPGDLAIAVDIVDFTRLRPQTFYDSEPVVHVDVTDIYCPEIRKALIEVSGRSSRKVWNESVLACTDGPRYETPAEIRMMRNAGCDIVGMTSAPEAFLARELEMCYGAVCFVTNMAAGLQKALSASEVTELAKKLLPEVESLLKDAIVNIPPTRACRCRTALSQAGAT
ncbi:S-methyl-5'-thioadenosine phosphorylase [[Eubacterium] cellulosolvens]